MKQNTMLVILALLVVVGGFGIYKWRVRKSGISAPPYMKQNTASPSETLPPVPSTGTGNQEITKTVSQIPLTITSPVAGAVVNSPNVLVKGTTVPGAEVNVNDKQVSAGTSGAFSATVTLDEGENTLIVMAVDKDGNSAEQELTVTYTPLP